MDKYEYNLKLDQMKTFVSEGEFESAAEIADSINWNKIKNVNALVKAGEVYEKVERYEDAREILLAAYDRSPIGRTIIYRLAEVAIKMQDYDGAQEYYEEFVDIAPHDNQRYILKYHIKKSQGASYQDLIPILEEFKDKEYTEEWAFELAYLYHKAGIIDKCIDSCDELILWFGDGPYVERALELKMLYQPLTKTQEEKYKQFRHEKEGKTVIGAEEMKRAGEYVHETVAIPQITLNPSRFNTTNLQEEIVKGMQQIMEATEKETVVGTMDNIKKIAEEIPYLQLPTEEELAAKEAALHIETDEEIDGSLRINFQELLGEEDDGQISLVMKEKAQLEQQITGQMTIAEVLEEWEKTKRAAETALHEAEQRKLESAKARALHEAEDIMDRLNDVLPKIEAVVTPKIDLDQAAQEEVREAEKLFESMNSILDKEINRLNIENEEIDIQIKGLTQKLPVITDSMLTKAVQPIVQEAVPVEEVEADFYVDTMEEEDTPKEIVFPEEKVVSEEIVLPEEEPVSAPETEHEKLSNDIAIAMQHTSRLETTFEEKVELGDNIRSISNTITFEKVMVEPKPLSLSDEQKAIFSYFMPVKGMETQLCKALAGVVEYLKGEPTMPYGNLIIQGSQGCGKTVLATSIVKVLQMECGRPNGRIGKIEGGSLNKKEDLHQLLKKVAGGCLIIEKAGDIDRTTAVSLSLLLEQDDSGLLVILEDSAIGIKKVLATDDGFAKKFTQSVTVPIFTNDELVVFAQSYANELGYEIEEMAILALHNRISNIEKLDQATTLVEVKEIIDEAIEREANGGIRKAFNILTAKRYTDDDKIVLTEKDFE
ncbi:MAG: tetratricopeptide repeat protein [Agathobacter sp.]|nr:tetratricopeptide repeat protein [Agathobacter sp.]